MEYIETFLKLPENDLQKIAALINMPESERQRITETLLLLKNVTTNVTSCDSGGKSGINSINSVNLPNSLTEKTSKQKTLDNWIVKRKVSSQCEEKLEKATKESSNFFQYDKDKGRQSQNTQFPSSSPTILENPSKPDNVSNIKNKELIVLDREECVESELKSPNNGKLSFKKKSASPLPTESPIKKNEHFSEYSNQKNLSPEKHSPILIHSYNLRRSKGFTDEKTSSETSNSKTIPTEFEEIETIHNSTPKSGSKQKPKVKKLCGKNTVYNSSFEEVNYDQKNSSYNNRMSKEMENNSECKTSYTAISADWESTSKVISVDSNKTTQTNISPTVSELDTILVVKRKRTYKGKESKKICAFNAVQKNSNNQESGVAEAINANSKRIQNVFGKKMSIAITNPSELPFEKTVQLSETVVNTSPSQDKIPTNDILKPVYKLNPNKASKSNDKKVGVSPKKIKQDSIAIKAKGKKLHNQEINFVVTKDVNFQSRSYKQLQPDSQNKESDKETEALLTKDTNTVTSVNKVSKRIGRKRGSGTKFITKNSLLSDLELFSKLNDEETSSQIKEFSKETNELLIKDTNTITAINAKIINKKKSTETKSKVAALSRLISDSEQDFKNNEKDNIASETSLIGSSKDSPFKSKDTGELVKKCTNTVIPLNDNSKRINRKRSSENKSIISVKNSSLSDVDITLNNNKASITPIETLLKISSSKNKVSEKADELLIKKTNTITPMNTKIICKKKGSESKGKIATKINLISDSEQDSKNNEKDNIPSKNSLTDSSNTSSSQSKEFAKNTEELVIKDTNTVSPLNVNSKKIYRKRDSETKSKAAAKNISISDLEYASKNSTKDNIASSENSSFDSSKKSPLIIKDIFTNQTSLTSATEKTFVSLNKNKFSKSINSLSSSDGHSRKNSEPLTSSFHDKLNTLIEMKDLHEDQAQNSSSVLPNALQINDVLHTESDSSNASKKTTTLKTKTRMQSPTRKKLKIVKDKKESNTSNNSGIEMKNSELNLKKSCLMDKVGIDSNKEQSDNFIAKLKASSSLSNEVQEPKDHFNAKLSNNLCRGQKKKTVKKIKKSPSKKKTGLKSQVNCNMNSSKNNEMEKINFDLLEKGSVEKKLYKSLVTNSNRKPPVKSTNKGKVTKKAKLCNLPKKQLDYLTENEPLSEIAPVIQMKLYPFRSSMEKAEINVNSLNSENIVDLKKDCEMIPDLSVGVTNNSKFRKESHDIIKSTEGNTEKAVDFTVNNSNSADISETSFKTSSEFDENMKQNYEAFCKVKEVLNVIGISIEDLFENPEMINSLKSVSPDGVYFISKCKSDSKISVCMHESKTELRAILNKSKKKYSDEVK